MANSKTHVEYPPLKEMVTIPDSTGNTMKLAVQVKRPHLFIHPAFNKEMIDNLPDYPLRDDDVMICSYSKSGCHWLWEIVRQLVSGKAVTEEIEKDLTMLEVNQLLHDVADLPSPRVLSNHQYFDLQPRDILRKRIKTVLLYRNPKDIVVSFYHQIMGYKSCYQFTGDFQAFLVRFAEGLVDSNSYFEFLKSWEKGITENQDLNICIVSYEDLKNDTKAQLRKLAQFLGKDYDEEFLESVVTQTSFDVMKEVKGQLVTDENGNSGIMYRKGQVGDWKKHFTVAQNEWFDIIIRTRMAGSNLFNFTYSLN